MDINYWDCKYCEYEVYYDDECEDTYYGCNHTDGEGYCDKDNKWFGEKIYCKLAKDA